MAKKTKIKKLKKTKIGKKKKKRNYQIEQKKWQHLKT